MHVSVDTLRGHLDYSSWATRRLLDAAAALSAAELRRDFGTADKSLLGTLTHVFGADRIWLARIQGGPPEAFTFPPAFDLGELAREWTSLGERWKEWAGGMTDDGVERELAYRDIKGNAWVSPIWQIVLHVVNHGTHHRGQAAGFLRAMGQAPPPLDLIAFFRATAARG